jgi:hypothetical protein
VEEASSYTILLIIEGLLNPWGIRVAYNVFSLCKSLPNMKNEIRAKYFVAIFQLKKWPNFEKKKRKKFTTFGL